MTIRKTPALYASGKYVLSAPFVANPAKTYTCMAIRSFTDVTLLHEDVFVTYYQQYGITESEYELDVAAKVSIVTLMSESGEVIYVPDSHIESYPDISNIPYSRIVLSVDLGALPDVLGLDFLITQLQNAASAVIGVASPTVLTHKVPTTGFISAQDHASAEAARVAGITAVKSDYTRLLEANAANTNLRNINAILVQKLRDLGEL